VAFVSAYDRALASLVRRTVDLGREVEHMLHQALIALEATDAVLAASVRERDDYVDAEDTAIEADVLELISWQQPRQRDLRRLAAILRVGRDLERIADYSCDIADSAGVLAGLPRLVPFGDLTRLGRLTRRMVHEALVTVESEDLSRAGAVNAEDEAVDRLYADVRDDLVRLMEREPRAVRPAAELLLVARYLERVGDHAVNIAETTVFTVEGRGRPFHQPATPDPHEG
jgi:phosphate transport system protein